MTINIYHSVWKTLLFAIIFMAGSIIIFRECFVIEKICNDGIDKDVLIILFLDFYSFSIGLLLLATFFKERLWHIPYMMVSDDGIKVNGFLEKKEVNFADVKMFDFIPMRYGSLLEIIYNPDVSRIKWERAGFLRRLTQSKDNYKEFTHISFLNIEDDELCNLLNQKLKELQNEHSTQSEKLR